MFKCVRFQLGISQLKNNGVFRANQDQHMNSFIQDTSGQDVVIEKKRFQLTSTKVIAALGALLAVGLIFAIMHWSDLLSTDRTVSREDIRISKVTRGDLKREITAIGKVVVANSPTLFSNAEGIVTYWVKAGDAVEKGQRLLSVDSPSLKNQLQQEQTILSRLQSELVQQELMAKKSLMEMKQALRRAELSLKTQERALARSQIGLEKQFVSVQEFELAEDQFRLAEVNAIQAKENLQLQHELTKTEIDNVRLQYERQKWAVEDLERRVNELEVISPVDGMVGSVALNQKSAVSMHQALMTVVDLSLYEAEVDIPEYYAPELSPGMGVEIRLNGKDYDGSLIAISPEIQNGQVKLRMNFIGQMPENLRQNQRITTNIFLEVHENVLRLPRGAYLDTDNRQSVFRVSGNKAERVPVKVGALGTELVEIMSGLKEGDEIIVSDTSSLRGAQLIYLTN